MSKGENIFKRRDGRWEARYIKGRDEAGRIKYGFCYGKTYHEAKEKVTRAKASALTGLPLLVSHRQRFSRYCTEWLQARKIRVKDSTYVKYDSVVEKHIKPKLGGFFPTDISSGEVEVFTASLLAEGLSAKSVHDILSVLRSILKYTSTFFPGIFPVIEINYPKVNRAEMRVLSPEEQNTFVTYLLTDIDPCKFGVLLSLLTGIRIGELCALRWSNISIEECTLYCPQIHRAGWLGREGQRPAGRERIQVQRGVRWNRISRNTMWFLFQAARTPPPCCL